MPKKHNPRRGSMAHYPRKRTKRETPVVKHWPDGGTEPKIQGFAGYKAGMTHAFITDFRPTSTTSGQEVMVPVTVVEVPPMKVVGIRIYQDSSYGLNTIKEVWTDKLEKELLRTLPVPRKGKKPSLDELKEDGVDEVRVIVHTKPGTVPALPKKGPEIMEMRIGGGTIGKRIEYAKGLLGKDIDFNQFQVEGGMVDIIATSKGKGFQGVNKRFGAKLLTHKNSKHRRMIGTQGPWHPAWIMATTPNSGQMGYHKRTEFNKRILKVGKDPSEINPRGDFIHYGKISNNFVLLHGSIPGVVKRLIRFRDPVRKKGVEVKAPEITYVSTSSKQGK